MMSIGFLYWLLLIIAIVFGSLGDRIPQRARPIVLWVLLALLGWAVFGWPIES